MGFFFIKRSTTPLPFLVALLLLLQVLVTNVVVAEEHRQQIRRGSTTADGGTKRSKSRRSLQTGSDRTLTEIVQQAPRYDTLESAVVAAQLDGALAEPEPLKTLLAPNNDAFAKLEMPYNYLEPEWILHLQNILLFHVTGEGKFMLSDVLASDGETVTMLNGEELEIHVDDETTAVTVSSTGGILGRSESSARVINQTDVEANNGVIHDLDQVLLPSFVFKNVVQRAGSLFPEFTMLVSNVLLAGLIEDLSEGGPFTVLAPTNDAFAAIPEELGWELLWNPNKLKDILLYHVIEGVIPSTAAASGTVETLNGDTIDVQVDAAEDGTKTITINGNATVVTPDVLANNGIIHAIDMVLLPPDGGDDGDDGEDGDGDDEDDCHLGPIICWIIDVFTGDW